MDRIDCCKICTSHFDEYVRPRSLPCGHSFCTGCINNVIEEKTLFCPKCKTRIIAKHGKDFPINYDLEEVISKSTGNQNHEWPQKPDGDNSKGISEATGNQNREESRSEWVKSKKMALMIDEQKYSCQKLLGESESLRSQIKEYHDFLGAKRRQHQENLQKMKESSYHTETLIQDIRDEEVRLAARANKFDGFQRKLREKLNLLNSSSSTKDAVAAIADLDHDFAALEKWNGQSLDNLPDGRLVAVSEKVLSATARALSEVNFNSVEHDLLLPDLSETNFTIREKAIKISGKNTITLDRLDKIPGFLSKLVKEGLVYAVHKDSKGVLSAPLSLIGNKIYLHCLQEEEPPLHVHTVEHSELIDLLMKTSTMVYLDLAWEGTIRGKVHIALLPGTPLARQFRLLCTGELGVSYSVSKFISIGYDSPYQYLKAGDYEKNNGTGGASLIDGLEDFETYHPQSYTTGMLFVPGEQIDRKTSAQFSIMTGNFNDQPLAIQRKMFKYVFGQVKEGLDVLKAASELKDIHKVMIVDCGAVLSL